MCVLTLSAYSLQASSNDADAVCTSPKKHQELPHVPLLALHCRWPSQVMADDTCKGTQMHQHK
jgi:hypothetical protein